MFIRRTVLFLSLLLAVPVFANLVQPLQSGNTILIPVAGSTPGGFGTYFRSEIHIINFLNEPQPVELYWLPSDGSGQNIPPVRVTIPALTGIASDDFVFDIMKREGLGSILIIPMTPAGTLSTNARLQATSRIWTRTPGSDGTVSQTFPSIPTAGVNSSTLQLIPSTMRINSQYRLNVGIINFSVFPQRYTVTYSTGSGASRVDEDHEVDVPALGMRHLNFDTRRQGVVQVSIRNDTGSSSSPSWIAYASNVDNITGDAWSFLSFNAPQ
ncbi:MAG TPA: hypothetical protein VF698_16000 [Thermoanaerobaculia bacterium]|jgi:hypothetical protein